MPTFVAAPALIWGGGRERAWLCDGTVMPDRLKSLVIVSLL